jgi:hypothetical protein
MGAAACITLGGESWIAPYLLIFEAGTVFGCRLSLFIQFPSQPDRLQPSLAAIFSRQNLHQRTLINIGRGS